MPRISRDQFESIVRAHHAAVHRSACRWLGAEAAADVTQDVFVRVLEGKVRLTAARDLRATLCWLATRLAANAQRARRRRERHEETAMNAAHPHRTAASRDPATEVHAAELQRQLATAMAELPDDLRLPLQMHCQDQLTFAEVGTALRVPASTAHERVQRALQRLRTALAGRGFAVGLAGLPDLVAAEPMPTPDGLEPRLLALGERTIVGGVGITATLAAVAATAVVLVTVAALVWWSPSPIADRVGATARAIGAASPLADAPAESLPTRDPIRTTAAAVPAAVPPAQLDATLREWTTSVFLGTVHDAGAWPVANVQVIAASSGGEKPHELGTTTTAADGSFRLQLGPYTIWPNSIRLRVVEGTRTLLETDELPFARAHDAAPLALVLPADVGTAMTRYELTVVVAARDGMPLPAVEVSLRADAKGPPRLAHGPVEATATTGGDGAALLQGRGLGAKWLLVDGRPAGYAPAYVPLRLDRAGAQSHRIVLEPGGSLEVHVARLDGGSLPWANVCLEHDETGLQHALASADLPADGRLSFHGLGKGAHTLHVSSDHTLSPARRRGLVADGSLVPIRLKRADDPRDVGDHMAELHGEFVDAETGAVVPWPVFGIEVLRVRDGNSTLPSDRLVPLPASQTFADDYERRFPDFHETALEPGRQALVARVPGYAPAVFEVDLGAMEVRAGLRIPLHRGGTLSGRVVDAAGAPVAGAMVIPVGVGPLADAVADGWRARLRAADPGAAPPSLDIAGYTGADGRFSLSDLPADVALRLCAQGPDGVCTISAPQLLRRSEVRDGLELRLQP
ncbi:MAG: sigma-70 family RNA polymerase sigma factor [Planctomycetes bacterium]|nr:sigma-70 family RNA polymerase sigma factor [Planctomycetota bacterium]